MIKAINPATDEVIKEYKEMSPKEVDEIIYAVHEEFLSWRNTSFMGRASHMKLAADVLRDNAEEYAELMANEMGKPIAGGRAEIMKCALTCDFYADNAKEFLKNEVVETEFEKSFVAHQPLGAVLAVMPWNFPFWQVFRFAAPALMAGNVGLLKHASNVPGCALAIEDVFSKAGFPENVFRTLMIGSKQVSSVIENEYVKAVTLTGSTKAGESVASKAGSVIKKTVLELGGSDAYIILEDADLESAINTCATSRLTNSGQSCIAAKRFVVVESVYQRFEELFLARMKNAKMGDPLKEDTEVGPQARKDLRDELHQQVIKSIDKGAKCLLGGEMPEGKGAFYPPTVLTNVKKGMPAYDEELFGPVASIISVKNEQEAIMVANDTKFGLGAAVFTEDKVKGEKIALNNLDAGTCCVNGQVRSDPRLPFGGIKGSGYGRELSYHGIKEFVNIKTIVVKG